MRAARSPAISFIVSCPHPARGGLTTIRSGRTIAEHEVHLAPEELYVRRFVKTGVEAGLPNRDRIRFDGEYFTRPSRQWNWGRAPQALINSSSAHGYQHNAHMRHGQPEVPRGYPGLARKKPTSHPGLKLLSCAKRRESSL